ncbi:MAG: HXXEE domain-containing protein [Gemmatimonadaceae bacterium]
MRRVSESAITAIAVAAAAVLMLAAMGRAVVGLVAALLISYLIGLRPISDDQLRSAWPACIAAVGAQTAHLLEEYHTGFYREFPPVLGAQPWSSTAFLLFNLAWLVAFGAGAVGLRCAWRPSVVVALFLALGGGVLNGLAHLIFAVRVGGYFPGLYTAPLVFCAGSYLAFRLLRRASVAVPAI